MQPCLTLGVYTVAEVIAVFCRDIPRALAGAGGALLLAACAANEPLESRFEPDMQSVARALNCPSSRMPTCVARSGGRYNCFCADDDLMHMILEPEGY